MIDQCNGDTDGVFGGLECWHWTENWHGINGRVYPWASFTNIQHIVIHSSFSLKNKCYHYLKVITKVLQSSIQER